MPTYDDYNSAIQTPRASFPTNKYLQDFRPIILSDGTPMAASGGLGTVFKLQHKSNKNDIIALKCFLTVPSDQKKRYKEISNYINRNKLPYFAEINYFEEKDGIVLNNVPYPVLMMQFVEGEVLNTYLESNLSNSNKLKEISEKFLKMLSDLKKVNIAHGDLQEGNIIVSGNDLKLVDYDGMYVPPLQGEKPIEYGLPNYQHPKRFSSEDFGPYLDNFSGWVIYLSIVALIYKPLLWKQFNAGNKQLLFTQNDFLYPDHSAVIKELERINNTEFNKLLQKFKEILKYQSLSQIPSIVDFTSGIAILPTTQVPVIQKPKPIPQYSQISATGSLSINTNPAGADVYINGVFKGSSPLTLNLNPGVYSLEIRKNGYKNNASTFKILRGDTKRFNIFLVPEQPLTPAPNFIPPKNVARPLPIRPLLTFVLILSMLVLTFYLPRINNLLKNKGASSSLPSSTTTVSTVLDNVQLLSPKNRSILLPGNLTLSWNHVNNAKKYEVLIYNEAGNPILDETTSSTAFTTTLNSEGVYRWSVRAGDDAGRWAPWSDKWVFTIAAISSTVKNGTLSVNTNPSGATIYIEGSYKGTSPIEITLAEGNYALKITKDGYEEYKTSVTIKANQKTSISPKLIAKNISQVKVGLLSVTSNPSGADIFIDGNLIKETTPLYNYPLKPGSHSIKISMLGYSDYSTSIQVSENQLTNLGIINLQPISIQNGFLTVTSNPSGADIFIDGNLIKETTPLYNYPLKPGSHSIKISMLGYKDSIRSVYIEANKTLSISVTLEKLEESFTMHSYGISPAHQKIVLQVGSNIITVDDKTYNINTGPEIKDGRTFIPLIPVSEALGYRFEWFADSKSVKLIKGEIVIELKIGSEVEVIKDTHPDLGWSRQVDSGVPPYIKNNEIMVPVRFIGEVPDVSELNWDPSTKTIIITVPLI